MKQLMPRCGRWLGGLIALLGLWWGSPGTMAAAPARHWVHFEIAQVTTADRAPALFTSQSNVTQNTVPSADQSVSPPPGPAPDRETRSVLLRKWLGALILVTSFYVGFRWIILRRR